MRETFTAAVTKRLRKYPGLLALAIVLVILVGLAAIVLPPLLADEGGLTPAERVKAENDVRSTLFQALAGTVLAAGLYFTARSFQLNREGQITERFTHAIDQLGRDKPLEVRLGGIYALERIARDSDRDHGPIMEVLTAYVREHSVRPVRPPDSDKGEKQIGTAVSTERAQSDADPAPDHRGSDSEPFAISESTSRQRTGASRGSSVDRLLVESQASWCSSPDWSG